MRPFEDEKTCLLWRNCYQQHITRKRSVYDKELELPDYDFYSTTPVEDAKVLDIYYSKGFTDVEAKAGVHHGTYKVFVNFMPVADITYLSEPLYDAIKKDAIKVKGILYAPPNFLRMSMYLELSRPRGDVSRWEKVLKRLLLLNRNYPLKRKAVTRWTYNVKWIPKG